jgi:two-component system sensor histidine kinase FlrB
MNVKLSEQSLVDASVIEAAAIYNVDSVKVKPKLRRSTDYITNNFLDKQNNQIESFEQASCLANRMTQLLDVLPGGVVVLDGEGLVQQCNKAAIDLLGEPIEGLAWLKIIKRAFKPKHDDGHDMSLVDGRLVHISTSPLQGEPGQIILLQDVTETRQLQQKVSHLQRLSAMGEVAARLAHQIRTPLSSALLYIAPLLKEDADTKLKQRFAKRLHNSITHMEHLVKDMLAFSRGDMTEAMPISVDDLLNSVEQQFLSHPDVQPLSFNIENNVNEGVIYGSKDSLTSAINNLLNNARFACYNDGEITIYVDQITHENEDFIEISVEDNGVGIAKDEMAKVLTPFFTTRSSGTGLGLAVVKSIAKAHHGEVWFDSVEGEGSTFVIRLPLFQSADKFTLTAQS